VESVALAEPESEAAESISFAEVVEAHWHAVFRMVHTLTGNSHDTEDLTQETFLRALKRLATFQRGTNLRAWLLRIAANAFFDTQRKRKRANVQPMEVELPASAPAPGHRLEVAEESELLKTAMTELPNMTRLVFHLRATEDLSFKEIADMVGSTEQAARWHMHEARVRLLKKMGNKL
jgi:RNA polymerase sigma-70 factor (ECF subfamily)